MPLIPIQTLDDPRLVVFRDVKATRHSKWKGRFIAEGARLVKRLLATDYDVESMLLTEGRVEEFAPWLRPDVPTFVMPQTLTAELVGYNFHCGAMACALRKPNPSLDEIMARGGGQMTFVVCPDVNDPENIGTLIRLGAAFGIDAMLLGPACADPFSRRVLRVSMGNALLLPIVCSRDLDADLRRLKSDWQVQLAATVVENSDPTDDFERVNPPRRTSFCEAAEYESNSEAMPMPPLLRLAERGDYVCATDVAPEKVMTATSRPDRLALLFGNEANGLGPEWLELCDRRLTIPMRAADSLNVAIAAGIFLHHFTTVALDVPPSAQSVSIP